jgi:hypothetical protein
MQGPDEHQDGKIQARTESQYETIVFKGQAHLSAGRHGGLPYEELV